MTLFFSYLYRIRGVILQYKTIIKKDLQRYSGGIDPFIKRYLILFRKTQFCKNKYKKRIFHYILKKYRLKHGIEIDSNVRIGAGLYIGHPFNITINDNVIIGNNCNIHKGVLIGQENRGKRQGTPIIGDFVWIGINACIVGAVQVGNDVLIAPNAYVNCNVPSHSIVIGNPCKIIHRDNATEGYINNRVEDNKIIYEDK